MSDAITIETSPVVALELQGRPRTLAGTNAAQNIGELLRFAIEQNVPVDSLKQLVELHERISDRQAAQEFAQSMQAFQEECPSIKKTSSAKYVTNSGGTVGYAFADLEEIASVINPILARHGLSYGFDSRMDKDTLTCVCTVRHTNGHREQSTFALPVGNSNPGMSPQQKVGAALTFAKRYSLSAALGLTTTEEDTDAAENANPQKISEDQVTVLEDLLTESGMNRKRFLTYMGVGSIGEIAIGGFAPARNTLSQAVRDKQKREAAAE